MISLTNKPSISVIDFSKKSFWVFLESCISMTAGLALILVFTNLLSSDVYGVYKYVIAFAAILSSFSLTGIGTATTRFVSKNKVSVLYSVHKTYLLWALGAVLVTLVSALYYYINNNYVVATGILIVGSLFPLTYSFGLYQNQLIGQQEIKCKSILAIIKTIISTSALIITIVLTSNILIIISIYTLSLLLLNSIFFLYTVRKNTYVATVLDTESINYSKHLSVMSILTSIANHIDQILIFHYLGATQLAIYSIASVLPQKIKGLFFGLKDIVMPKLVTKGVSEMRSRLPRVVLIYLIVLSIISATYTTVAPWLFQAYFPYYIESVIYTQVLSWIVVCAATMPFRQALFAHAHKKKLYVTNTVIPLLKITMVLTLVPLYGIWGAVFALLITRVISSILSTYLFLTLK